MKLAVFGCEPSAITWIGAPPVLRYSSVNCGGITTVPRIRPATRSASSGVRAWPTRTSKKREWMKAEARLRASGLVSFRTRDRKNVGEGKEVAGRGDLGGRRNIK